MIIIWCHDLMDHNQIMLSVAQGVTCGALTFQYALHILTKKQLRLRLHGRGFQSKRFHDLKPHRKQHFAR